MNNVVLFVLVQEIKCGFNLNDNILIICVKDHAKTLIKCSVSSLVVSQQSSVPPLVLEHFSVNFNIRNLCSELGQHGDYITANRECLALQGNLVARHPLALNFVIENRLQAP